MVAHELAHVKGDDILRGIACVALVAPLGVLFVQLRDRRAGAAQRRRPALPGGRCRRWRSRWPRHLVRDRGRRRPSSRARVEARADTFALELTDDPQALIGLQQRLAVTNVADPDPPAAWHWLLRHPPDTMERIGAAVAFGARAAVKTVLLTVGKVQAPFADADAHYRKLLGRYQPLEVIEVRDDADLVRRLPADARVVALDREGRARLARLEPLARRAPPRGPRPLLRWSAARRAAAGGARRAPTSGSRSGRRRWRTSSPASSSWSSSSAPPRSSPASRTTTEPRRADHTIADAVAATRSRSCGGALNDAARELPAQELGPSPALERPPQAELRRLLLERGDAARAGASASRRARSPSASPASCAGRSASERRGSRSPGPGFLNLFLSDAWYREAIAGLLAPPARTPGAPAPPSRERVLVEFVSANPTGPLTAAGGRHAAYGDSVARAARGRRPRGRARVLRQRHRRPDRALRRVDRGPDERASRCPRTATRASTSASSPSGSRQRASTPPTSTRSAAAASS